MPSVIITTTEPRQDQVDLGVNGTFQSFEVGDVVDLDDSELEVLDHAGIAYGFYSELVVDANFAAGSYTSTARAGARSPTCSWMRRWR
jgi:hypothetical protein